MCMSLQAGQHSDDSHCKYVLDHMMHIQLNCLCGMMQTYAALGFLGEPSVLTLSELCPHKPVPPWQQDFHVVLQVALPPPSPPPALLPYASHPLSHPSSHTPSAPPPPLALPPPFPLHRPASLYWYVGKGPTDTRWTMSVSPVRTCCCNPAALQACRTILAHKCLFHS